MIWPTSIRGEIYRELSKNLEGLAQDLEAFIDGRYEYKADDFAEWIPLFQDVIRFVPDNSQLGNVLDELMLWLQEFVDHFIEGDELIGHWLVRLRGLIRDCPYPLR